MTTDDGSLTLQQVDTGWTYRSTHGALREAAHVFVGGAALGSTARVLEFGFGAGTNFAAALAREITSLDYTAVERAPLDPSSLPVFDDRAHALASEATRYGHASDESCSLRLHLGEFAEFTAEPTHDAVFLDPFGPHDEPESWSLDVMKAAAAGLAPHGRLVTYSAAGWIRRNLAAAGLHVATFAGPPGKREFTVAAWDPALLAEGTLRNAPG